MNSYLIYAPLASVTTAAAGTAIVVACFIGMIVLYIRFLQKQPLTRRASKHAPSQYSTYGGPTDPVEEAEIRHKTSTLTTGQPVPTTQVRSDYPPVPKPIPPAPQPPPHRAPATKIPITENWSRPCNLCNTEMQSPDDRLEWHGIGNCVPVCMPCAGSGKQIPGPVDKDGWPVLSPGGIAALPDNYLTCPACDGRGYETLTPAQTEAGHGTFNAADSAPEIRMVSMPRELHNRQPKAIIIHDVRYVPESEVAAAYTRGRAQATTPLPIASVPSQFPAGTPAHPRAQLSSVEKLLTFLSCCDVCGAEAANLELNVQCDTCLGRTVTKLVDEWKNDIRGQIQATPIFKCDICRSTTTANHCDVVCHKDSCIQHFVTANTLPTHKDVG